ncbi:MAG: transcriptional repressor [Halocynthiibacter sp.]
MSDYNFTPHDHNECVRTAIDAAETYCAREKLQFTKLRRRVLELLLTGHKAKGAYDLLAVLTAEGLGSQPPVVYRALDFLVTHGFAHKIENRNAYIACAHPKADHVPAFLICRSCDHVVEAATNISQNMIVEAADASQFVIEKLMVEAEGLCPSCQDVSS